MWTPLSLFALETWILIASVLALAWYYVHRKWQYLHDLDIPHDPPSLRNFGHLRLLFGKTAFTIDNDMKKKYGPIWGAYNFFSPGITCHDPDILRRIFIKEFHTFPLRRRRFTKVNGKEMNENLTNVEGKQWKRIRSTLTPTFSTAKLRQMTYIMDRCVDNAEAALDRKIKSNGGVFNPKTLFSRLSLDMVCSAAFSTEVNSQDDTVGEPEIAKQAKKLFTGSLLQPMVLLCYLFPPMEKIFSFFKVQVFFKKECTKYFKALTHHVISHREANPSKTKKVDLMQLLLDNEISEKDAKSGKLEKGMDRNEIIGNSILMILAGYENTANSMSYLAYSLAQYPDIQKQLYEEIDEMMQRKGAFDYDSVAELKFLDMCVHETLRLYMPVLRNGRLCDKEITINGLTVPKGVTVNIPAYGLAHDPEYWDDPEMFKPERMRDMSKIDPILLQPFGAGPRNCIGMRFALMEIKMGIAKLVHHFRFEPAENTPRPPLKLKIAFSVKPVVDYDLKAIRRSQPE